MWILDSEGDFLKGKRVWLRPGKKYLFGRVKQGAASHVIDYSSISRRHVVIEVLRNLPGSGAHLHMRSKISVTDSFSKHGTTVDGKPIGTATVYLDGVEHVLRLGKCRYVLRIKWVPVVFSFSFSSKELKSKDPLARIRSRLEDFDIKTIIPYIVGHTTHVVQSKRNTAKGLQALVNAKYIVQESYLSAVEYAATPSDLESLESLSPLESDFDAAWPDPSKHLPLPGREPTHRPAEAFTPDPGRSNIFEGYTFIFGDLGQFNSLQDPINDAHGKAMYFQIKDGITTADEIIQFMGNANGPKGLSFDRAGPGRVVLVRFRMKGSFEQWSIDLGNQVALMTDQRVIEQSEFLDAILESNASLLCRALPSPGPTQSAENAETLSHGRGLHPSKSSEPLKYSRSVVLPQGLEHSRESGIADSSEAVRSKPKSQRVRSYVSKMKTFDDGFDVNLIPAYTEEHMLPPAVDSLSEESTALEPTVIEDEEDVMSSLLPGATAMKRRRPETERHRQSPVAAEPPPVQKRRKLDIREAARQHREAEEEAERARQEAEEAVLKDSCIENLKDLAIVEEMDLPTRAPVSGDGWDERWNGRKNFKRFRRKGDNQSRYRVQAVIVPLEEVTRKKIGIGEHRWVTADNPSSLSRRNSLAIEDDTGPQSKHSRLKSHTPSTPGRPSQKRAREVDDSDSEEELRFRFRRQR